MSNVILEKTCNAFYPGDAGGSGLGFGLGSLIGTAILKRSQGGLWVGGTFTAEPEWLYFETDILNFVAHSRAPSVRIHASELRNIRRESGWVTDIVVIEHARGEFKFRCLGAEQVVSTLTSYYFRSAY